jgi:hypothetical protein
LINSSKIGAQAAARRSSSAFFAMLANECPFVSGEAFGPQRLAGGVLGRLENRVATGRKVW